MIIETVQEYLSISSFGRKHQTASHFEQISNTLTFLNKYLYSVIVDTGVRVRIFPKCLNIEILQYAQLSSKISSTAKPKLQLKSLDSSRQRSQFKEGQEGLNELLGGNSRTISDCWVCSIFKTLPGCWVCRQYLKIYITACDPRYSGEHISCDSLHIYIHTFIPRPQGAFH